MTDPREGARDAKKSELPDGLRGFAHLREPEPKRPMIEKARHEHKGHRKIEQSGVGRRIACFAPIGQKGTEDRPTDRYPFDRGAAQNPTKVQPRPGTRQVMNRHVNAIAGRCDTLFREDPT